jgi:hypothetical protein
MPSIGDVANDIARTLYELRIPVAVASLAGFVLLAWVARRLGWFAAARRHPRRAASALAVVLAVTVPIGWYLGSPLFVRTSLVEAEPVVAPVATPMTAPDPSPTAAPAARATSTPGPTPATTAVPTPFQPTTVATGSFSGTDEFHFGRGTASLIEVEPGRFHLRLDDFSVRNGPDLFVLLSPSAEGYAEDALELGRLKATDGSFGYDLPAGVDPARFRSALIWCKQFSHLFAVAPLVG